MLCVCVCVGDTIASVNEATVEGFRHKEIVQLIRACGNSIRYADSCLVYTGSSGSSFIPNHTPAVSVAKGKEALTFYWKHFWKHLAT